MSEDIQSRLRELSTFFNDPYKSDEDQRNMDTLTIAADLIDRHQSRIAELEGVLREVEDRGQDRHGNRACPMCAANMDYGSTRERFRQSGGEDR